jgi:hypothetical protein
MDETFGPDCQAKLIEMAEGCLRSNAHVIMKNVSCDYRDGVLVLRGSLPTYYLKQLAQEVVAQLHGIKRIDNQIQVTTRPA